MKISKEIAYIGLFVAVEVILTRFFSIQTPIVRIGFGFLPIALAGMLYGPVFATIVAALADFIGAVLFPFGAYFPGFTISAALTGMIFGIVLHGKNKNIVKISIAVVLVSVFVNLILDTIWLWMLTGEAINVLVPVRLTKCIIMIPIQVSMIYVCWNTIGRRVKIANFV